MVTHAPTGVVSSSTVPVHTAFPVGFVAHRRAVETLLASARAADPARPLRLAKHTSNLFRPRVASSGTGLDVRELNGVIAITVDSELGEAVADVQGMCTYETLVATTLPRGYVPLVVPQLKTITLGGAVTGLGIESTSFRSGLPHESVLELDILTASGEIVTATKDNEHRDLFAAFPNSYGTLGYAVRLRILLEPVSRYVRLRNLRFTELGELVSAIGVIVDSGQWEGREVDYLDGVVFSAKEGYLVLGSKADELPDGAVGLSDYTGTKPYYQSLRERSHDVLTLHDYLWRWDTDWFWCSKAFGAQHPLIRPLWPARWRRSDVYHRLVGLENRYQVVAGIERLLGKPAHERVVQDVELPLETTQSYLQWFLDTVGMNPVWLCPLRLRSQEPWPIYPMSPNRTYVNVGFWGAVDVDRASVPRGEDPSKIGTMNRLIEAKVTELGGHKSLYSDAYYSPEEFSELYHLDFYDEVRHRYDPKGRLLDLYSKTVLRR